MKIYLLLFTLFIGFSQSVYAHLCESTLVDRYGYELDRFYGNGRDINGACADATAQCKRELVRRGGQLRCKIHPNRSPNPPIPPTRVNCQTVIKDSWGRILRSYTRPGPNRRQACRSSLILCQQNLDFRRRSGGGHLGEYCQILNSGNSRNQVTRMCRVNRQDQRFGIVQTHYAQARGVHPSEVMRRACFLAMNECNLYRQFAQLCLVIP